MVPLIPLYADEFPNKYCLALVVSMDDWQSVLIFRT